MTVRKERLTDDIWLIGAVGRLDQQQTPELEKELQGLLDEGFSSFIVDFSEVTYVNSGGLRSLVTVWRQARAQGGSVALCSLNPRVMQVINIVGFDKVFQIYPTREAALQSHSEE